MRQIKFRVWDGEAMHYPTVYEFGVCGVNGETSIAFEKNGGMCTTAYIMQSTGIKDKNQKDIYEGDILYGLPEFGPKNPKTHRVVWYSDIEQSGGSGFAAGFDMGALALAHSEVVGNIYEMPEDDAVAGVTSELTTDDMNLLCWLCSAALEAETCSQYRNLAYIKELRDIYKKLGSDESTLP